MIGGRKVQVKKAFGREERKGSKGEKGGPPKKKEWKKDDKKGRRGR